MSFFPIRFVITVFWFFASSAIMLPLLLLRPRHPNNTVLYTRAVMPIAMWLCGFKVEVRNRYRLYKFQPCVYVCNHQNFLDLFIHGSYHPKNSVTVGKKSLAWIPIFGWIYALVGSVLIDRKNHQSAMSSMGSALALLKSGKSSIWVFPEGTRSNDRGLLPFKRGAFRLAIDAGKPILPVATSAYYKTIDLKKVRSGRVLVEVLEPISTVGLTVNDVDALMHKAREAIGQAVERLTAEVLAQK